MGLFSFDLAALVGILCSLAAVPVPIWPPYHLRRKIHVVNQLHVYMTGLPMVDL
jgi:hypothetical protein